MIENWRDIPGYEGRYQVSDQGRVRSLDRWVNGPGGERRRRGKTLRNLTDRYGYHVVPLQGGIRRKVHRLVLLAFVGPCPPGHETAHHDGNARNNSLGNLRYATSRENADDRIRHGTNVRGERQHKAKLTAENVRAIRASRGVVRQCDLASAFGVSQHNISAIQRRTTWKYLP